MNRIVSIIIFLFFISLGFSQQKTFVYKNFSDSCFKPGDLLKVYVLEVKDKKLTANKDSLRKIADFLKKYPLFKVEIGFNGNGVVQNPAYTKTQASEWKNFLFNDCGIDTLRFYFKDNKSTRPLVNALNGAVEKKINENRRTEITILPNSYFPYKNPRKNRNATEYNLGDLIDMPELLYDLSKASLRPESVDSLKKWAKFIFDHPEFIFEVSTHTDTRGSDKMNLKLTELRIKDVYYHLTTGSNVPKERVFMRGYGESQILVSDDEILKQKTKEEKEVSHQRNRRSELRIIGKVGDCNFLYNP